MLEVSSHSRSTREEKPMKSLRDEMEIVNAYDLVDTYRGAAALCATTAKTVRWWSTASHGWCNWGFARPATSGGQRPCSSCASQHGRQLDPAYGGLRRVVGRRFG